MSEPIPTIDRDDRHREPNYHDNHPKGPNFLLIVILFGVVILIGFVVAYFVLAGGGKHLVPGKHAPHPTSHLVFPAVNDRPMESRIPSQNGNEPTFIFPQQKFGTSV